MSFTERFGREPSVLVRSPGCINLMGDHTEYNLGYVLPVAIDRYTKLTAAPNKGRKIQLYSEEAGELLEIDLEGGFGLLGETTHWGNYVRGAVTWLQEHGYTLSGGDVLLWDDLPEGLGMSAANSLTMGLIATLSSLSGWMLQPYEMARATRWVQEEFIGQPSSLVEPLAIACAEPKSGLFVDSRSEHTTCVPLNFDMQDIAVVVAYSGIQHDPHEPNLARRRKECESALGALKVITYNLDLRSLRDVDAQMLSSHGSKLYPTLFKRARHVTMENDRVLQSVAALSLNDFETVGALMNESHRSLSSDYEVSNPFIDRLVELAMQTEGVLGAKLTGEGFGGCTINLVKTSAIRDFNREVVRRYSEETTFQARTHIVQPSGGLEVQQLQ